VVIPPLPVEAIPPLLSNFHGVLLSGGPDIHPEAYGESPHRELGPTWRDLDRTELALAREAVSRKMPILAICRGAQALNVARGGTLFQHLPDRFGRSTPPFTRSTSTRTARSAARSARASSRSTRTTTSRRAGSVGGCAPWRGRPTG
jgi:putative glutamine amidotransferase